MCDQDLLVKYIEKWGVPASIALLDPKVKIFKDPDIDGIIGYKIESNCAIVFGEPICNPKDLLTLTNAFHEYFAKKTNIIYTAVSQKFLDWFRLNHDGASIQFGNEIILDPSKDIKLEHGKEASLLRNKYRQSIRDNIFIKEYIGYNKKIEAGINLVKQNWLKNKKGPQIYLLEIDLFSYRQNKRWFYAEHNGEIIGAVLLNKLDKYKGWVLNLIIKNNNSHNCTSEFLIMELLNQLNKEDCHFLSIGPLPNTELSKIEGFGFLITFFTKLIYNLLKKIFKLTDRQRYWKKFYPIKKPSFLVFHKPKIGVREILAITKAFNVEN